MKMIVLNTAIMAVVLGVASANAAEITNRDKVAYKLVVLEGSEQQEVSIGPEQTLTDICKSSCSVWVGNDPDAYELKAADVVAIEEGQVYYVGQPAPDGGNPDQEGPSIDQAPSDETRPAPPAQ